VSQLAVIDDVIHRVFNRQNIE